MDDSAWAAAEANVAHLARHVDIVARWRDAQLLTTLLAHAISENPPTLFDCYLPAEMPPEPGALRDWRAALPYSPGYRDCVAVYRLCRRIYSTTSNPNANKTASRSS